MPTYLYKNIETGEIYELKQSMRDDAYTEHPQTGVAVKRILARPSIAFKGSGFYVNDSKPSSGDSGNKSGSKEGGNKEGGNKETSSKEKSTKDTSSKEKSGGSSK